MRPPLAVRFDHDAYTVVLPTRGSAEMVGKLSVRKLAPGMGSWMSVTSPIVIGRVYDLPPSREMATTCEKPCSNATYTDPSGPVVTDEPWRPLPVPLLPAGESWFGAPNDAPPSAEDATMTGSLPLPFAVFERNSVQLRYVRPKNGLAGVVSTAIQFLSLKSTALDFDVARTGAVQVTPLSSEVLTMIDMVPFAPGKNARLE